MSPPLTRFTIEAFSLSPMLFLFPNLGTALERGISAWQVSAEDESKPVDKTIYNEGYEVYNPLLPKALMRSKLLKYIPFLPYKAEAHSVDKDFIKI